MSKKSDGQSSEPTTPQKPRRRRSSVTFAKGIWIEDDEVQQSQEVGEVADQAGDNQHTTAQPS